MIIYSDKLNDIPVPNFFYVVLFIIISRIQIVLLT